MELKSYNTILVSLIYKKNSTTVEAKQIFFADLLQLDVHCSTHLKNIYNFLIKPLIKIIQISLCSIFSFHSFIPYLPCSLKSSEASFIFFSSSPALSSSSHLSDLSHQPSSLKLSSPCKAKAVAVTSPSPSRHRRRHSTVLSQALKPLIFFSSSQALISLRRRRQPTPQPVAVPAHARRRRRHQPTSGQCSLFFSSEFFNCCFGLIFLDLVLFCGEKWCCPYVILGKIKKKHLYWNRMAFFFFFAVYVIIDLALCEFFAIFAGYNI